MIAVSIAGAGNDLAPAKRMLGELLDPERRQALVTATRFLEAQYAKGSGVDWNSRYVATTTPGERYEGVFAGAGGGNFMLGAGDRVYIGKLDDLPRRGAGLRAGGTLAFRAGGVRRQEDDAAADYWKRTATAASEGTPHEASPFESETARRSRGPRLR